MRRLFVGPRRRHKPRLWKKTRFLEQRFLLDWLKFRPEQANRRRPSIHSKDYWPCRQVFPFPSRSSGLIRFGIQFATIRDSNNSSPAKSRSGLTSDTKLAWVTFSPSYGRRSKE